MHDAKLPLLEIGASAAEAELSVILMHGLGADGHDFESVAIALSAAAQPRKWRFVLPHAPTRKVTINMGMPMPAWYDILDMDHPRAVNWGTVAESQGEIEAILDAETSGKIVLAGFSQGAAMALHVGLRHPSKITGILMMSGYLLESEEHPVPPSATAFPIGMFHGREDPVVPFAAAEQSLESLRGAGYEPALKAYEGLEHAVSEQEIRDVFSWLNQLG